MKEAEYCADWRVAAKAVAAAKAATAQRSLLRRSGPFLDFIYLCPATECWNLLSVDGGLGALSATCRSGRTMIREYEATTRTIILDCFSWGSVEPRINDLLVRFPAAVRLSVTHHAYLNYGEFESGSAAPSAVWNLGMALARVLRVDLRLPRPVTLLLRERLESAAPADARHALEFVDVRSTVLASKPAGGRKARVATAQWAIAAQAIQQMQVPNPQAHAPQTVTEAVLPHVTMLVVELGSGPGRVAGGELTRLVADMPGAPQLKRLRLHWNAPEVHPALRIREEMAHLRAMEAGRGCPFLREVTVQGEAGEWRRFPFPSAGALPVPAVPVRKPRPLRRKTQRERDPEWVRSLRDPSAPFVECLAPPSPPRSGIIAGVPPASIGSVEDEDDVGDADLWGTPLPTASGQLTGALLKAVSKHIRRTSAGHVDLGDAVRRSPAPAPPPVPAVPAEDAAELEESRVVRCCTVARLKSLGLAGRVAKSAEGRIAELAGGRGGVHAAEYARRMEAGIARFEARLQSVEAASSGTASQQIARTSRACESGTSRPEAGYRFRDHDSRASSSSQPPPVPQPQGYIGRILHSHTSGASSSSSSGGGGSGGGGSGGGGGGGSTGLPSAGGSMARGSQMPPPQPHRGLELQQHGGGSSASCSGGPVPRPDQQQSGTTACASGVGRGSTGGCAPTSSSARHTPSQPHCHPVALESGARQPARFDGTAATEGPCAPLGRFKMRLRSAVNLMDLDVPATSQPLVISVAGVTEAKRQRCVVHVT
eukprot:NODE_824_length_2746_cov_4.658267.p1 GENE.NODE_824_length_2746_cov_4.658267~~NODE_824_length_2746_cov_4.658267.p1  ORF type:complete len:768 (+),score=191.41 NODE_824_length_2746_cov_4.658267:96-2399(+)